MKSMADTQIESGPSTLGCEPHVPLGPDYILTPEAVEAFSLSWEARADFSDRSRSRMAESQRALQRCIDAGQEIYGLTTGFGPHVRYAASPDANQQGDGLIAHLGAGCGSFVERGLVRAMMLVRLQTLAQGRSGIDPEAAEDFLAIWNAGLTPAVPCIGSVGASGDLIPMAHVARVLTGTGTVLRADGQTADATDALASAGLAPRRLTGRDALAIVNGTSFMTAHACVAMARAERMVHFAELLTGWAYRMLGCRSQALDPRLHEARGHLGQIRSAERIRHEAESFGAYEDTTRPLQEVYSLRCAPQILGAVRDQFDYARDVITFELNGVSDNPVVCFEGEDAVLHGGNFQGQQIAFASDVLSQSMTQIGLLVDRQIDAICNPELTGATLLLAWEPGATSGLAGAQITATALAAEMRQHASPAAITSIPTNGRNQDIVSMGANASRAALGQTDRLARVLAVFAIGLAQLGHLRSSGRVEGRQTPWPTWLPPIDGFDADRPLYGDIERLAQFFLGHPSAGTDQAA